MAFRRVVSRLVLLCAFLWTTMPRADDLDAAGQIVEVAAFGVSPIPYDTSAGMPAPPDPGVATRVIRGDTWPDVLRRLLGEKTPRLDVGQEGKGLPELTPGRYLRRVEVGAGDAAVIDYLVDARSSYRLRFLPRGFDVVARLPDDDLMRAAQRDAMKASLFSATDAVGLPDGIAMQLVAIFAEEIDFLRDLGQGYRCALVYEMRYQHGMPQPGRILAAELSHGGRRVSAFLHRFHNGEQGYFKPDGTDINRVLRPVSPGGSSRRAIVDASAGFRRSPLEFSRVTSAPSASRFHPILKQWRAHRGIDYGAPLGTQVKATADGVVHFVGYRGSYGNLVILRHYDRFTTFYGHLNGFARDLKAGDNVRKGDVIGFVGMTGLASGPHLHYELHDALAPGRLHTPLEIRVIDEEALPSFQSEMSRLRAQLDHAYRANLVLLE